MEYGDNLDNNYKERGVFYLEKNRVEDFRDRCLIAIFVEQQETIEFISYVGKGHFIGRYRQEGNQQHIYLFNKPQKPVGNNYTVFVSRITREDHNVHYEVFSKGFMDEYRLFRTNAYSYIRQYFFEWYSLPQYRNLFVSREPSGIKELYKYKLTPDNVLKNRVESKDALALDDPDRRYKEFVGGKLTFTNPMFFNDPFDCDCNVELLNLDSLADYIYTAFSRTKYNKEEYPMYSIPKKTIKEVLNSASKPIENIEYVIRECIERYWNSKGKPLSQDKLYKYTRYVLDSFDSLDKGKRTIKEDLRVLCTAKKPDDILMWGYYTDGGRGVCCEYQFPNIISSINTQKSSVICIYGNIDYEDEYMPNYIQKTSDKADNLFRFVIERIFTKYSGWRHEQEFRIAMIDCSKKMENWETVTTDIAGIYYGVKADKTYEFGEELKIPSRKLMVKAPDQYKLNAIDK